MNFSCDRCAKRYSLADAKVPAGGFRVTCKQCGNVFAVRPPPPPTAQPPAALNVAATTAAVTTAAATTAAEPPAPLPGHHGDPHEGFYASAPGSHHPSQGSEAQALPGEARPHRRFPVVAIGLLAVVGLAAGGLWWVRQAGEGTAAPAPPPAPRSDAGEVAAAATPPEASTGAPAPPTPGAALAPERPQGSQGSPGSAGGMAPGVVVHSASKPGGRDLQNRSGSPIARKDKRLLDLLDRKQDAPAVAAPAAGELNTGRASLDMAAVQKTLADNAGAFSACIAKEARADPRINKERRTLVLELVVRPTGRVSQATLDDPAWARTPLGQCLGAAARRIIFPSFEGEPLLVQAPLKLSAVQ